jgi:hypothetical protein
MTWPPDLSSPEAVISLLLLALFSSWTGIFWAILTGRLVPGEERDTWREMALTLLQAFRGQTEVTDVTKEVLRAIPRAASQQSTRRRRHGDPNKAED